MLLIYIGLFEEFYEPMPTLDEPLSVAAMSPFNDLNNTATVQSSNTTTQGQPWQSQKSAELAKCREFIRITCDCTKANGNHVVLCLLRNTTQTLEVKPHF